MATFRATLLAVSPCTLCSATETVPGSFVSLFSGTCFTTYTSTPLPESLAAVLGRRLTPDDTGTMLCPRCLRRMDGLDLLQSRRQQLQDELMRLYRMAEERRTDEARRGIEDHGDAAPSTCLACHAAVSEHDSVNAFWKRTQHGSTTLSDMLSKLLPQPPEPGRPAGDCVCRACVGRLDSLAGLTERTEQQCRLIVRQYRAAHGLTTRHQPTRHPATDTDQHGPDPDPVQDELRTDAASEEQLNLLSQLDTMLHRLSPDRFTEVASHQLPRAGLSASLPPASGTAALGSPLAGGPTACRSPYDPDGVMRVDCDRLVTGDADDPEPMEEDAGDREAPGGGADEEEVLGDDVDGSETLADVEKPLRDDVRHIRTAVADEGAAEGVEGEEEVEFGVGALLAETVYSVPNSPSTETPGQADPLGPPGSHSPAGPLDPPGLPGPVRTIYVQLVAGGAAAEKTRARPGNAAGAACTPGTATTAAVRPPGAADSRSTVTKVAQTVKVVCLGPKDRLVPRPLPYRKRSDRAAAASAEAPTAEEPPVKRGRGRPRKTSTAVKRQYGVLHRKLQYVTARDLTDQKVETVDLSAGLAPADLAQSDLAPADLAPADLAQSDLAPADLAQSDLTPADLPLADMPSADPSCGVAGPGQDQPAGDDDTATEPTEERAEGEGERSEMEPASSHQLDEKAWDAEDSAEDADDPDWLEPPVDSAQTTHRRRLAEAMERVNSRIAAEKLQSERPPAGKEAEAVLGAAAHHTLPRPDTSQEWAISGRSRRVDGLYVCEVCQNSFAMLRDLLKHEKTHKEAKFPCPMCNKSFTLPKLVRKHQKFHKTTTAYQCDQCGLRCRSQLVLLDHMHQHTGSEHLSCGVCQLTFASRQRYRAHERLHTGRRPPPECTECGRRFSDRAALQRHRQEHSEPRLPCPQPDCDRKFDTEKLLTHHLLQHVSGPPWRCNVCDKEFKTKYSLRDHMRGHSGQRPFGCELCAARFSLRSNLIMHMRYVHHNDLRFKCTLCGKRFKRRRLLDYHMMAHEGKRPLSCPHCPLQMIYPEHFKQHLRTHSGEKPYRCDVCSKSFSRSDNLKAHMFTHSNKKPFECRQCGMGFMRKMSLLQHMAHLGHGEHPDDYVINRTLVTTELVPPDEEVHTLELVDGQDGHLVMLVKGDGRQEMLIPDGHFVTADGQQIPEEAPFLNSEVQYVTADGQRLDLIIDETAGGADGGGGTGGDGSDGDGDRAVDLVIEESGQDPAAGAVDLILQDGRGQLVLQGDEGQQLVLRGDGEGDAETEQWVLQGAEDGRQIVLQDTARQLQLGVGGDGGQLVQLGSGQAELEAAAPFAAAVPTAGV